MLGQSVRIVILLGFVALGLWLARVPPTSPSRRRAVSGFLAYVLAVHAFVAASQADCWPFSSFPMMANDTRRQPDEQAMISFRGVDAGGREWEVDPASWAPLYHQSMRGWFEVVAPRVSQGERREAVAFLLSRAEEARAARASGRCHGNERVLGPLAAPDTYAYGPRPAVAPDPFVALRVYRVSWDRRTLLDGGPRAERTLLHEVPTR
jgi:hypothetical protein